MKFGRLTQREVEIVRHNSLERTLFEYLETLDEYNRSGDEVSKHVSHGMRRVLIPAMGRTRVEQAERALKDVMPKNPNKFFMLYYEYLDYCVAWDRMFELNWEHDYLIQLLSYHEDLPDHIIDMMVEWVFLLTDKEEMERTLDDVRRQVDELRKEGNA